MSHPLLNAFWMIFWFFLWIMWLMLLFRVFADLFRDRSLSGWAKAGWALFVCVLPFIGVFAYLAVRGRGMEERGARDARDREKEFQDYIREAAGSPAGASADELVKLADLRKSGALSDDEFQQAKTKLLT